MCRPPAGSRSPRQIRSQICLSRAGREDRQSFCDSLRAAEQRLHRVAPDGGNTAAIFWFPIPARKFGCPQFELEKLNDESGNIFPMSGAMEIRGSANSQPRWCKSTSKFFARAMKEVRRRDPFRRQSKSPPEPCCRVNFYLVAKAGQKRRIDKPNPARRLAATNFCRRRKLRLKIGVRKFPLLRAERQLAQLQFHCGTPPPAAEPRIRICTAVKETGSALGATFFAGAAYLPEFT